jgi:hypothetical protein
MLERDFKKKVREDFEKLGWVFIVLDPGGGVPMGFPDTECISPTGYHCYVEWKKSKNAKKQPLQEYWNKKLNSMGHDAWFVYPENVEEWRNAVIRNSDNHQGFDLIS